RVPAAVHHRGRLPLGPQGMTGRRRRVALATAGALLVLGACGTGGVTAPPTATRARRRPTRRAVTARARRPTTPSAATTTTRGRRRLPRPGRARGRRDLLRLRDQREP